MTQVTFIHTSDLQLGITRKFLDPDAQARYDDARLQAVTRLGEVALERGAEFIVVAGDVFEHNSLDRRTTNRALEKLRALPVPVYLLPGNHDPLVADSIFRHTTDIENVHVLDSSDPVVVRDGVEIVGVPLMVKHATEDLVAKALAGLEPTDAVRILVGHGAVEGFGAEFAPDIIDLRGVDERLADGTIDYVALGDTHSATSLGTTGRVWYSGSPEVTDFKDFAGGNASGEVNSGKALVVTASKGAAEVEEVPIGTWSFHALEFQVNSMEDVQELLARLREYDEKPKTVIKYSITGTLGLEATQELQQGLADLEATFGALYERERLMDLHLEPGDDELAALPLTGFARDAMEDLVSQAASDPTARDAVNLLFRLSQKA